MILIFSNQFDQSTRDVVSWLDQYFELDLDKILLINSINDFHFNIEISVKGIEFEIFENDTRLEISNLSGLWYRRNPDLFELELENEFDLVDQIKIRKFHVDEFNVVLNFLFNVIPSINKDASVLSNPKPDAAINKLIVLKLANENGLEIPNSYVSTRKKYVELLLQSEQSFIYKPLSNGLSIKKNNCLHAMYTEELTTEKISDEDPYIFPVLIQEKLNKLFEIRTCYFGGAFYSIAIFSQTDEQTNIDFRKYNFANTVRESRFQLPDEIEIKLKVLVENLGLEFCSIDLIYTKDDRYVFLEINPIGQFGMVSQYYQQDIERSIGQFLSGKMGIPNPI